MRVSSGWGAAMAATRRHLAPGPRTCRTRNRSWGRVGVATVEAAPPTRRKAPPPISRTPAQSSRPKDCSRFRSLFGPEGFEDGPSARAPRQNPGRRNGQGKSIRRRRSSLNATNVLGVVCDAWRGERRRGPKSDVAQGPRPSSDTHRGRRPTDVTVQRAQLEHANRTLIGKPPPPRTVARWPRRPGHPGGHAVQAAGAAADIAGRRAAGRRGQRAEIGIAKAGILSDVMLNASVGFEGSSFGNLFTRRASSGPSARRSRKRSSTAGVAAPPPTPRIAAYDATVAGYRQTTLKRISAGRRQPGAAAASSNKRRGAAARRRPVGPSYPPKPVHQTRYRGRSGQLPSGDHGAKTRNLAISATRSTFLRRGWTPACAREGDWRADGTWAALSNAAIGNRRAAAFSPEERTPALQHQQRWEGHDVLKPFPLSYGWDCSPLSWRDAQQSPWKYPKAIRIHDDVDPGMGAILHAPMDRRTRTPGSRRLDGYVYNRYGRVRGGPPSSRAKRWTPPAPSSISVSSGFPAASAVRGRAYFDRNLQAAVHYSGFVWDYRLSSRRRLLR